VQGSGLMSAIVYQLCRLRFHVLFRCGSERKQGKSDIQALKH
jgi:hypothetical protein